MAKAKATEKTNFLETQADKIRAELKVSDQNAFFKAAVEAGYLTARADGNVDGEEREAIVRAVELLSQGAVIEWEVETLLDTCSAAFDKDGADKRAEHVGAALLALGASEPGLFVGAIVARATGGVDKTETGALKTVGKAAGLSADKIKAITKRAASL